MGVTSAVREGSVGAIALAVGPRSPNPGFPEAQLPAVFELLARVARAIVATVGPDSEVVVHDLRNPEHSVVAISGHLTGRQVGAPVPDPQLLPGTVDKFTNDDLGRTARTPHGRELLASTAWVRDGDGHIVGALCINADLSGLREARELIDHHLGRESTETRPVSTFAVNVAELTRLAIASVLGPTRQGRLRKAERVELVRQLDAEGVFTLRHAAETVAAELGVSRSSVYGDLHAARLGRPGCPAPQQP